MDGVYRLLDFYLYLYLISLIYQTATNESCELLLPNQQVETQHQYFSFLWHLQIAYLHPLIIGLNHF